MLEMPSPGMSLIPCVVVTMGKVFTTGGSQGRLGSGEEFSAASGCDGTVGSSVCDMVLPPRRMLPRGRGRTARCLGKPASDQLLNDAI